MSKKQSEVAKTQTVYCGPTIKDVVKQYTVFTGELPETLTEYAAKHPTVKNLIVPLDKFAEIRVKIETPKTAENIIFRQIKTEK